MRAEEEEEGETGGAEGLDAAKGEEEGEGGDDEGQEDAEDEVGARDTGRGHANGRTRVSPA